MAIRNYFINGITELLILSILNKSDSYVYEISKQITSYSGNILNISQNTIYTATYKLETENKISEYSKLVGKKRIRVYYHIEDEGREYLQELLTNYHLTAKGVQNILNSLTSIQEGVDTNEQDMQKIHVKDENTFSDM